MSLRTSGLIVVFVPLLLVCFVLGLNLVQSLSLERSYAKEAHSRVLFSDSTALSRLFIDAANTLMHYYSTKDSGDMAKLGAIGHKINLQVKDLHKLVAPYPQEAAAFKPIANDVSAALREIKSIVASMSFNQTEDSALTAFESRLRLEQILQRTVEHMDVFLGFAKAEQAQQLDAQAQFRAGQRTFAVVLLVLTLLVASAVSLLFFKNITQRLTVIVDNTKRVEQNEQLNPRLSGADEIAKLDETFHKMYASQQQAKEQAEKLEELKREFYAMITHDLRSPLLSIGLSIEVVLNRFSYALPYECTQKLNRALASAGRLSRLIDNFLDVEKLAAGKYEMDFARTEVAALLEKSADAVEALLTDKNLTIQKDVAPDLFVYADRDRTIQVLVNLLANAIKFSPENGSVTLSAKAVDGKSIEFQVIDQGPGISSDNADTLFQKFKQLDAGKKEKGTGLGLAICKMIVDQQDGTIGVTSEIGKGSNFWFRLMRAD